MKEMSFKERVLTVTDLMVDLMDLVSDVETGKDVDFKHFRHLIRDLHRDAVEMATMIHELEGNKAKETRPERKITTMI